eukprot:gene8798-10805_t
MRVVGYVATFIGGIIACYLLFSLGVVDKMDGIPGSQEEPVLSLPTYLSFLSVMMTAVTAVLAALAIGIGIIAAYTFKELKDEARTTSEKTSKEVSESTANAVAIEALSEVKVKAMVFELYAKAEKERQQKQEWGDDPIENEER